MKSKVCLWCNKSFTIAYRVTQAYWERRKYCSNECRIMAATGVLRGHRPDPKPASERFWSKVDQLSEDECWEWKGSCEKWGYGVLYRSPERRNSRYKAHVLSWIIHFGDIPDNLCVLHKCDNKPCVNPKHLFLGTRGDNNRDRTAKGRTADHHGEANPNAKLTPENIKQIRSLRDQNWTQEALGSRFGVSQAHISRILLGDAWSTKT